ncbi:hypothetical protein BC941DRAFT_438963 [Chlamydoabsidia padenii]|nr:hypothetical protein BC941DRAFT_438963 [Chlamydoabsidia padenii]
MKYAKSDISGKSVTIKELLEWNEATYKEPLAWSSTALEWFAIYLLVGNKGVVKKQDIQAVYDGTLFYQLRDRNKTSRSIQGLGNGNSSSSSSSSTISISGVKVPKSYIQQLETQLNKVIHTLPHPTVSVLETRLRHWLSFTQQQQQQVTIIHNSNTNNTMNPILKGVMTPDPVRRTLFSGSSRGGGGNETTQDSLFVDHDNGLTGVITADKVEQTISLAGVQGYEYSANDDDVTGDGSTLDSKHGVEISDQMALSVMDNEHGSDYNDGLSFSMAGIRSEEKEETDWLYSGQLTGVSPSPSLNLADYQDSDKTNGGSSNDNKDGAMLESESLDDTHSVATPSLIDNGSTASDLDDPYDDNSTREIHSQESKNTDMQQDSKNTDIQQSVNTDTRQINNEISNGNKTSGGKKSKKNKKKKNRQQQQQPASSPSAKDYNVDYYMAEQQQQRNQSLPLTTPTQHLMTQ